MKLMVSIKQLLATLILTGIITGCSSNPTKPNYSLDSYTLTHSAIFTQKELINSLLENDSESAANPPLLNSYCDLIERRIIFVSRENLPSQCSNRDISHQSRSCAQQFHVCVRSCSLRTDDCSFCVERQDQCLRK